VSNNAAERALRGIALGRKSWLFAGSDRGGQRAAAMYSIIVTAKMNDVDPQARLADVLARIAEHPFHRLNELLPWNWRPLQPRADLAASPWLRSQRSLPYLRRRNAWRVAVGTLNRHVPEDGCLRVYGVGEDGVTAFTGYGIECLKQIIADQRAAGTAPPPIQSTE
jgi:IS66 C-terminal element/Transposase IS66 family